MTTLTDKLKEIAESEGREFEIDESIKARFWSKVKVLKARQCWDWSSSIAPNGYGKISIRNYPYSAHVISYIIFNGPIKDKMVIDHKCMNKKCVNPNHLRMVTYSVSNTENTNGTAAINKKKTHCKYGHEFDDKNTIIKVYKNRPKARKCRECRDIFNKTIRTRARQTRQEVENMLRELK